MAVGTHFDVSGILTTEEVAVYYTSGTCCGIANPVVYLKPGYIGPPLTVLECTWTDDCGDPQPLLVDGQLWATPLTTPIPVTLADPDFPVQLAICSTCATAGIVFFGRLSIQYTDGVTVYDQDFDFQFMPYFIEDLPPFTTAALTHYYCHDDVNCPPMPKTLEFMNTVHIDYWVSLITTGLCRVDGVSVPVYASPGMGFSFLARAQQTYQIEIYNCPGETGTFNFQYEICSETHPFGGPVAVTEAATCCSGTGLNNIAVAVYDESDMVLGAVQSLCDPAILNSKTAIGQKLYVAWQMQWNGIIKNKTQVWFNPWLFGITCDFASKYITSVIDSPPIMGWYINIHGSWIADGLWHDMALIGGGPNTENAKNFAVQITVIDDMTFQIRFDFYMMEDVDNWLNPTGTPNRPKLLQNHRSAPSEFDNTSTPSVYNSDKNLCLLAYIRDPGGVTPDGYLTQSLPWTSRFYNKGLYNGTSEMTNPVWELSRGGTVVTDLASYFKTKIKFTVDYAPGVTRGIFWLINAKAANVNDAINFLLNYDASRTELATIPGVSILDNKLYSPSQAPTNTVGSSYEMFANAGAVDPNGLYYVIAVCYGLNGLTLENDVINSFITGPFTVQPTIGPENCCLPDIDLNQWSDLKNNYSGCHTPTVKERIAHSLKISGGDFEDCLAEWGADVPDVPWFVFATQVRLNIYRRVTGYPSFSQNTYFLFDQFISTRSGSFPGVWTNPRPDEFAVSEATGPDVIDTLWNGRVRWESGIPVDPSMVFTAINTSPMNKIPAGGAAPAMITAQGANMDWANTEIWFEYTFTFDLSSLFGFNPATMNHVVISKIRPIDFEQTPGSSFPSLFQPLQIYGVRGVTPTEITGQFCVDQYEFLLVRMESLVAQDGFLVALISPDPDNINTISEEENTPSLTVVPAVTTPEIYDVSPTHLGTVSSFKIDLSTLTPGMNYKVCGVFIDKKP